VRRARFSDDEDVQLTLAVKRRNYIEGLFLSSGIIRSSDYTMEQIVEVARRLREDHRFRGYIHLKTIPDADPELVHEAGLYADRLSINVELPTAGGLKRLAPEKSGERIEGAMRDLKGAIEDRHDAVGRYPSAPKFAPAGQSTQMIVGADSANDAEIIGSASRLYDRYRLRRVYYSAFSPIPDSSAILPLRRPPLIREHRLYQSDWMIRFYGFTAGEVAQATDDDGMMPLDIDPKLAWALKSRDLFPVDINRASKEMLLRVPGLGTKAVGAILAARRIHRLRLDDIARLTVSIAKLRPFIIAGDWRPVALADSAIPVARQRADAQLELFAA
jgi:putative DNA modification/repair radical SAM protein